MTPQRSDEVLAALQEIVRGATQVVEALRDAVAEADTLHRYSGVSREAQQKALRYAVAAAETLTDAIEAAAPRRVALYPGSVVEGRQALEAADVPVVGQTAGGLIVTTWDAGEARRVLRAAGVPERKPGKRGRK